MPELAQLEVGDRTILVVEGIERVELHRLRQVHDRLGIPAKGRLRAHGARPEGCRQLLVVQRPGLDLQRRWAIAPAAV